LKKNKNIIGIILLILAAVIAYMGFDESRGIAGLSSAFSDLPSDSVMIKYAIAAILAVIGLFFMRR
jgi:membrane protein implicated in regulation of membrane protease activity